MSLTSISREKAKPLIFVTGPSGDGDLETEIWTHTDGDLDTHFIIDTH